MSPTTTIVAFLMMHYPPVVDGVACRSARDGAGHLFCDGVFAGGILVRDLGAHDCDWRLRQCCDGCRRMSELIRDQQKANSCRYLMF